MSKYDLMKNVAKKNASSKTTTDSSKTVSKPAVKTTQSKTTKSSSGYWQDEQQNANRQAVKEAKKSMNLPKPKQTLSQGEKRRAVQNATIQSNRKREAEKKAKSYDPNKQQDYSQANEGIKALFSGKDVGSAMRGYANANKKLTEQRRLEREGQAESAQAYVDTARNKINSNKLTKAISDTGLSALGGLTSGIGGQLRAGSNLVQGIGGLTGNQDLVSKARKFDEKLGIDKALQNVNENNSVANKMVGKVAQSIGGMVPTIAGNIMSGGSEAVGLGTMFASSFGNEGSEAFKNLGQDGDVSRQDAGRALAYGGLKGGLEVGTEMLSSLIPGLDTFAFTNPNHIIGQMGGEALEEMVSSAVEPVINPLANQNVNSVSEGVQDAYNNTFGNAKQWGSDIAEAGVLGAATSLAMGAGANAQNIPNALKNVPSVTQAISNVVGNNAQNNITPEQRARVQEFVDALSEAGLDEYANSFKAILEGSNDYTIGQQSIPFEQMLEQALAEGTTTATPVNPVTELLTKSEGIASEYLPNDLTPMASEANESMNFTPYKERQKRAFTTSPETFDMSAEDYLSSLLRASEVSPDTPQTPEPVNPTNPEPIVRELRKKQAKDVAYVPDNGVVTAETTKASKSTTIPADAQAIVSNEDTISDGRYNASEDYFGDSDTIEVVKEAVSSGDPVQIREGVGQAVDTIASGTALPQEVIDSIKGDLQINRTAERLSEGDAVGYVQENVNETDAAKYTSKINARSEDTTYQRTRLDPVSNIARDMNSKIGDTNQVFDDLMKTSLDNGKMSRFSKAVQSQFGIQTDYDAVVYTARVMDLKDQLSAKMNKLINEIKEKGYDVELIPTPAGENTVRFTKDGKVVNPEELGEYAKELTDLASKDDDVTLRATNIGHNVATILRMFRTDFLSPAGQIKGINQTIESINAELDKKFSKQIKNGELEHVKINDDLVKTFLEATDDATRSSVMEEIGADIGHQVPPTFMEKLDAFRYNNLLFNGLTWVRNGLGNLTQSQMANAKNIALYTLESVAKARGLVRYNNLDMTNSGDVSLLSRTSRITADTLINDFADAKKSGHAKKHLKALGYNGALLNTLQHYKGSKFDISQIDSGFNGRLNEVVANNAKKAGYSINDGKLIDKNGNVITDETYRKLINDSYKQAKKQWLSSDSLRRAKVDGIGMGTASRTQRSLFWNEGFDILNPDHESAAGLRIDNNAPGKDAFMKGYNEARRSEIFSDKNPFGWIQNRESKAIDYVMNKAPLLGDDYWLRSGYSKAMASMLDTRGYHAEINDGSISLYDQNGDVVPSVKADSILAELNSEALQWAKEDTYHDKNDLANLLNEFARTGNLAKFTINSTVPFINTPMNIARRAIEYSPIGLGASLLQLNQVKEGKISASTWLNNMAKGNTGVIAMAIGAWLAKHGILRALGDKDDDEIHRFETAKGLQDYSIQIPFFDGWSTTVDWLAPGISPFLLGAAMYEQHSQYVPRSEDESAVQKAVNLVGEDFANFGTLFKPIADTTMLSGLMDTLSVFGSDTWAQDLGAQIMQNYLRQLTPVLGSKLMGIYDPVKYSTSSDSFLDRQLRSAAINIRLIDYAMTAINDGEQYLKPQLDLNGQPIKTQDYGLGAAGRAITNLLNPATVKEDTRDDTDKELERLYSVTGQKYLLPSITASINGTKFTPKERDEFNRYLLPEYKKAAEEFIKSTSYNDYDDTEKAQILYNMKSHYYTEAQAKYLGRIIPNADQILTKRDKACDFANSLGVSTAHFYGYISTKFDKDKNGDSINNTRAMKIRAQMEADGVWEKVTKAIEKGTFEPGDFYLNKAVTSWDTAEFTYYYNQMLNGQYDGKLGYKKNNKKK